MEIELTGTIHEGDFISEKYKNASFHYSVHIPECAVDKAELGLIVTHDGLNKAQAYAADLRVGFLRGILHGIKMIIFTVYI